MNKNRYKVYLLAIVIFVVIDLLINWIALSHVNKVSRNISNDVSLSNVYTEKESIDMNVSKAEKNLVYESSRLVVSPYFYFGFIWFPSLVISGIISCFIKKIEDETIKNISVLIIVIYMIIFLPLPISAMQDSNIAYSFLDYLKVQTRRILN